ncbi:MAG: Ldh family oxidoreductase [Gammaproteobacteria bacterium]|nr:Ldh family oxidoreductase [Gammaproteobacteria bacterium]
MFESNNGILVKAETLEIFCKNLLKRINIDSYSSECLVDTLIQSNLRGYDTHGVVRLIPYVNRFRTIKWRRPEIIRNERATGLIDGNDCMGQVCAKYAMETAMGKAEDFGVGLVGVKNSNHFGRAAYFSLMAANKNMIGIAFTNASSRIPPWGGKESMLGNNPQSYAFPTGKGYPLVLDISHSVVSAGKIRAAKLMGEKIPEGWAADKDGKTTQDPAEALDGFLLPMGGHKGYGLALVMDILCGILTGSEFAKQIERIDKTDTAQHIGHFIGAINVCHFMSLESFIDRIDALIDILKSSQRADGVEEIYVPGEIEHLTAQKRAKEGIPLEKKVIEALNSLSEELGEESRIIGIS